MSKFLEFLSEFQTLIVGFFGFVGVIATLFLNAKIGRDQHKYELQQERNSVRHALLTELKILKSTFEDRSESQKNGQDWLLPKHVNTNIYQVLMPKMGLLSGPEIQYVVKAYLLVNETPLRLSLLAGGSETGGCPEGYIHIENRHVEVAKGVHKAFLHDIGQAIEVLTKNINEDSEL